MPRVTSARYQSFLNRQIVEPIDRASFDELLKKVQHERLREARALCILAWTTGSRPNEIIRLIGGDLSKNKIDIWVKLPGSKGSLPRTVALPGRDELVKELWSYANTIFPGLRLFPSFYSQLHRGVIQKTTKKGQKVSYHGPDGKGYTIFSSNLRYYFRKWFDDTPYVFRHNRMTIAAEDLNLEQLKQLKGAKSEASIWPYVLLTKKQAKKIGRSLVK